MFRIPTGFVIGLLLTTLCTAQEPAQQAPPPRVDKIQVKVDLKGTGYSISVDPWLFDVDVPNNQKNRPSRLEWDIKLKRDQNPEEDWPITITLLDSHPFGEEQPIEFKGKTGVATFDLPEEAPDGRWRYKITVEVPNLRIELDPEYTKRP